MSPMDGGLRPILDLRRLNYSLYRGKFRMLTLKSILSQVQEGDWFVTVDLKDAYFHIFGGLSGLDLDADPSGPCSGRKHQIVFGPLQAGSLHLSGPVSQAPRPHGSGFPGSSLGAAPYETIPLVDEVPGYLSLLAIPPPTKSVRRLSPHPLSVAGPQFSLERSGNGGSLPSPDDNDGCFPLRMGGGGGLRGKAGLWCLDGQVPRLAHKQPGVESGSSGSHSLSSVPGTLSCHSQDGQYGSGVTHQSPGRLSVAHPKQACAPTSPLGTGHIFVPESDPCPRGPEPSGGLSVRSRPNASFGSPSHTLPVWG